MPETSSPDAIEHLSALEARVAGSDLAEASSLVEEIQALAQSVRTFHMEAIRFRYFGLRRRLTALDDQLPDGALADLQRAGQALAAAGFQTE